MSCSDDYFKLQDDLSCVYQWSLKWQLKLNPKKCEAIISNKCSPINFEHCIGSCPLLWSQKVKYLGVVINSKLKWNDHCQYVVSKATKCLNRLRRATYIWKLRFMLMRHLFDPTLNMLVQCGCLTLLMVATDLLESVQNRAAHWIKSFWDPSAFW